MWNRGLLGGGAWGARREDVEINCKCKKYETGSSLQFGLSHLPYSLIPDVITEQCTESYIATSFISTLIKRYN
jgi:hypothetical protein